jgi:hypothetical protein
MSARKVLGYAVLGSLIAAGTYTAVAAPAAASINPLVCAVRTDGLVTVHYSGTESHLSAGTYTLDILERVRDADRIRSTKLASTTRPVSTGSYIGFRGFVTQSHTQGWIVDVLKNRSGAIVRKHYAAWDCTHG